MSDNSKSITTKYANKFGVDPAKFYDCLKAIIFKKNSVTNEEMMAFLIVCDRYDLNPFMREIYAIQSKDGNLLPTVSVDGWYNLVHRQKTLDGLEFVFADKLITVELNKSTKSYDGNWHDKSVKITAPEYCDAIIYVKGMSHPYRVREYFEEVVRATDNWERYPRRMLRHKALIQCARAAFSFGGVIDSDDAEAIAADGIVEAMRVGPVTVVDVPASVSQETASALTDNPSEPLIKPSLNAETVSEQRIAENKDNAQVSSAVETRSFTSAEKRKNYVDTLSARLAKLNASEDQTLEYFRQRMFDEDFEWTKAYLANQSSSASSAA